IATRSEPGGRAPFATNQNAPEERRGHALPAPVCPHSSSTSAEDPDYKKLWRALGHDPTGMDALVERTGLTAATLSSMLLLMELDGRVVVEHGRYSRKRCPAEGNERKHPGCPAVPLRALPDRRCRPAPRRPAAGPGGAEQRPPAPGPRPGGLQPPRDQPRVRLARRPGRTAPGGRAAPGRPHARVLRAGTRQAGRGLP